MWLLNVVIFIVIMFLLLQDNDYEECPKCGTVCEYDETLTTYNQNKYSYRCPNCGTKF